MGVSDKSKQVIVVRRDLDMPPGKLAAQVAHAAMSFLTTPIRHIADEYDHGWDGNGSPVESAPALFRTIQLDEESAPWVDGSFTKAVLAIESEEALLELYEKAKKAGCRVALITDEGRTVFGGVATHTCIAIGPNFVEKVNSVSGHLKLYK